jgi:hypothetical protein
MHGWQLAENNLQEGKKKESGNSLVIRAQHVANLGE